MKIPSKVKKNSKYIKISSAQNHTSQTIMNIPIPSRDIYRSCEFSSANELLLNTHVNQNDYVNYMSTASNNFNIAYTPQQPYGFHCSFVDSSSLYFQCKDYQDSVIYDLSYPVYIQDSGLGTPIARRDKNYNIVCITPTDIYNQHTPSASTSVITRSSCVHLAEYSDNDDKKVVDKTRDTKAEVARWQAKFRCGECDKSFAQRSSLVIHKRVHSGFKPYQCNECPSKFSDMSTMVKHRRTHTGEKPYSCRYCHRRFSQSGNMLRHMRSAHRESTF